MSVVTKRLTWDDIKEFPESAGRTEIVDGALVMSPAPSDRHQEVATAIGAEIYTFVRRNQLGRFYSSPVHVVFAKHVNYEPDLCFVSAGRLDIIQSPVIAGPPDLVIEIISEDNRTHDTVVKFRDYERHGVKEYWLVDLREQEVRVFVNEGRKYRSFGTFGRSEKVGTETLQGLDLDLEQVFDG